MVFLFFLGIGIMAGVIFLAISPKSEFKVRIAALGALGLMVVTIIVCVVLYFKAAATPKQLILPDMMPSDMPPPANANSGPMIMLIVFLIALFVIIFILALKEQKRVENKEIPPDDGDW
jgi:cytochrome bd-type quinol oxidase subunit 2